MSLKERIYSVLVVSSTSNFNSAITKMLSCSKYQLVNLVSSISEAKRCLAEKTFDFVIINSPLCDESGVRFAIDCCHAQNIVVLILTTIDVFAQVNAKVTEYGVYTLSKPTTRPVMLQALNWMESTRERLRKMEEKSSSIEDRMEEIRIVNRAKCLLISQLKMTEEEAHHFIGKNAMNNCITKKDAAKNIIKLYG